MSRCFVVKGHVLLRCDLPSDLHLKLFPPHFWLNLGCWSISGWFCIPLDSSALEQRGTKSRYNLWFDFGNKVRWPFSFHGHGRITVWVFGKASVWLKSFFQASLLVLICCPYYVIVGPGHCMPVAGDLCEAGPFRFIIWYSQIFIFKFFNLTNKLRMSIAVCRCLQRAWVNGVGIQSWWQGGRSSSLPPPPWLTFSVSQKILSHANMCWPRHFSNH